MNNQFKIKDFEILNDVVNTLSINGNLQLFAEEFTVNYNLSKVNEVVEGAPINVFSSMNVNSSVVLKTKELTDLSELGIAKAVVAKLPGIELK